jgi:putative membrane protein
MEILKYSITGLPFFALYFAATLGLLALFLFIYAQLTPYHEFRLIREGNCAAAASISGTMLGFVIPLANSVVQSANLADMVMWGVIAMIVQLIVFWVVTRIIPTVAKGIPEGKVAQGVFLGSVSVATGILNAACITY